MFQESGATPSVIQRRRFVIQRRAGREETRGDAASDAETTDDDARVVYLVRATRATVRAT